MREPGEILCDKKEFTQIDASDWPTVRWNSKTRAQARSKSTNADFSFGEPSDEFIKKERTDGRSISRRRKEIHAYQWSFQTDRTGTRQRWSVRATWTLEQGSMWTFPRRHDIRSRLVLLWTFTCLCQSESRCWKAVPPQREAEARIAHDTSLLDDKGTNSRKDVGTSTEQQERDKAKDALRNYTRNAENLRSKMAGPKKHWKSGCIGLSWSHRPCHKGGKGEMQANLCTQTKNCCVHSRIKKKTTFLSFEHRFKKDYCCWSLNTSGLPKTQLAAGATIAAAGPAARLSQSIKKLPTVVGLTEIPSEKEGVTTSAMIGQRETKTHGANLCRNSSPMCLETEASAT